MDFPPFVADLVQGVFKVNVDALLEQMRASGESVANVAKERSSLPMRLGVRGGIRRGWLGGRRAAVYLRTGSR